MFERFAVFQGCDDGPNTMYPVTLERIEAAETRMQLKFPSELRQFFLEAGCGFWQQGVKDLERNQFLINRIADPGDIAGMVCEPDYPTRPCTGLKPGEIPFFDRGDRDYFLVNARSEDPNRVLWPSGRLVTGSLVEFFDRLYQHADFFKGGPGTF
jgi:hypothetical protein